MKTIGSLRIILFILGFLGLIINLRYFYPITRNLFVLIVAVVTIIISILCFYMAFRVKNMLTESSNVIKNILLIHVGLLLIPTYVYPFVELIRTAPNSFQTHLILEFLFNLFKSIFEFVVFIYLGVKYVVRSFIETIDHLSQQERVKLESRIINSSEEAENS